MSVLKKIGAWLRTYVFAPLPLLLIVAVGLILLVLGVKDLQIGGLISKILGKKATQKAVDVANTVPTDRIDSNGKIIPIGTPDEHGMTQAIVVPIENPGLFSNPDTVKIIPPGQDVAIEVQLPSGVKASDVSEVIVVKPEVYAVSVKDTSKVTVEKLDDLLEKYGK